jgi:hypothetical protein
VSVLLAVVVVVVVDVDMPVDDSNARKSALNAKSATRFG